jgi:hypothetical protein
MKTMLSSYCLLEDVLTNIQPITTHIKLTAEKAQFMCAFATDISIDLATHFIDAIQKATTKKETSLPFGGLISKVAIMAKVPLRDSEQ